MLRCNSNWAYLLQAKTTCFYRTAFSWTVVFSGGAAILYATSVLKQFLKTAFFPERKAYLISLSESRSIEIKAVYRPIETKVVVHVSAIDPWTLPEVQL